MKSFSYKKGIAKYPERNELQNPPGFKIAQVETRRRGTLLTQYLKAQ